ncbi:stage III sporulation protein AA [Alkalibacillus flavidus]|uniref:Stage III sporulation protein AA n=1 Tax=Alkalibacillus flavidus TaxID=546021 RepID=A0ABV2KYU3_9BACI
MDRVIASYLPTSLYSLMSNQFSQEDLNDLEEIRLRVGHPAQLIFTQRHSFVDGFTFQATDAETLLARISDFSIYRLEEELKNGYITVRGGHRIGISGQVTVEGSKVQAITHVSSFNIRLASEHRGAARQLLPYLVDRHVHNTLLIGPPKSGKTTVLRDAIRLISDGTDQINPSRVSLIDERSEIAASFQGIPQHDVGQMTDVMSDCPKADGMMMMVRSMSPEVLAVDEIGRHEDVDSLMEAVYTGVQLLCSVHGFSLADIEKRPQLRPLIEQAVFDRYIILSHSPKPGSISAVYNRNREPITTALRGQAYEMDRSPSHSVNVHMGRT